MFRFNTDLKTGKRCIRPMLVGSIKNDCLRRIAITLAYPFTVLVTWAFNYSVLALEFALRLILLTLKHLLMLVQPPWKSEVWDRPRTNKDEWMN